MKHRTKKLIVYFLVAMLVGQLCGDDMLNVLAATISVSTDVVVDADSNDDYVFVSGGTKTFTVESGVTLSGKIDFSESTTTTNDILNNYGTISGDIITGDTHVIINNYGTISGGSFNVTSGSSLYNTGTVSSVTIEGGSLESVGGSIGTINDIGESYISLSDSTVETVTTGSSLNVNGAVQATSLSSAGIISDGDGSATVEVANYVKATGGVVDARVLVQKTTVIDASEGVGYSVFYNDTAYAMEAGTKGTILDSYGKKVTVPVPNNSHMVVGGVNDTTAYLPGESIEQVTLTSDAGYYFPEDYCSNITTDGKGSLTATRVSESKVTISYTLSEAESSDVTITVISASLKPKEQGSGSIEISNVYYGAEVKPVLTSDTNDVNNVKVEYKKKGAANNEYRTAQPTKVGSYTARATFAETDTYTSCTATTDFDITYLPIPNDAYVIRGDKGENGYYTSKVEIIPKDGYSVAKKLDGTYKDSLKFTSSQDATKVYFVKDETGEKTKGKILPDIKIDITFPIFSAKDGETYYGESLAVNISDNNLSVVTVNNTNMKIVDGKVQLILDSDNGSNYYRIYAKDAAGNSRRIGITIADEWLRTGVIPANRLVRLSMNTAYQLDGGLWKVSGDTTQYSGGQTFYVRAGGEYTFGTK